MLNGVDLFSGIGGISLALRPWVRTIAYCESDRYCQSVLMSRMRSGELECGPIWDDMRTLHGSMFPNPPQIIYGGFPCQDISSAGTRVGLEGKRSGLFFELARLVRELRPTFVFMENVPDITSRGCARIGMEFTSLGYDCRWTIVSAQSVGACHIRERWFFLAYADGERGRLQQRWRDGESRESTSNTQYARQNFTDTNGEGLEGCRGDEPTLPRPASYNGWFSKPTVRRGANGIPHRLDRVRALGNSVVPIQAREAFKMLMGIK